MELNNTTSLFEIFTGFNLLYSLSKKETFADILNDKIVKPYEKSKDYIENINGEIEFYSQSTKQLFEQIQQNITLDINKKNELINDLNHLEALISSLKGELKITFEESLSKIEIAKRDSIRLLDTDFAFISLYFAFFSIQILYIVPTTNNHRILSILFLDIISLLILLSIVFRQQIEKFSFKQNFFGIFSIELNPIVNVFLFRISTWRNFSHMNVILIFIRVTVACFLFHFLILNSIYNFDYSNHQEISQFKLFLHGHKSEFDTIVIILTTLIPISHFIYISIISILKSIGYQLTIWFQAHTNGADSLRIVKKTYNRVSSKFNSFIPNSVTT